MKSFAVLSILLAVASAQDFMGLPSCAIGCTNKLIGETGCNTLDIKCICSNENFIGKIAECVTGDCGAADLAKVSSFSQDLCGDSGAPLPSSAIAAASQAIASSNGTSATATPSADDAAPSETDAGSSAGEMNRPAVFLAGVAAVLGAIAV